jgi:hypothetical protein
MFVRGLPGEQELLGTAREQLWQQPVQPVDGTTVALREVILQWSRSTHATSVTPICSASG